NSVASAGDSQSNSKRNTRKSAEVATAAAITFRLTLPRPKTRSRTEGGGCQRRRAPIGVNPSVNRASSTANTHPDRTSQRAAAPTWGSGTASRAPRAARPTPSPQLRGSVNGARPRTVRAVTSRLRPNTPTTTQVQRGVLEWNEYHPSIAPASAATALIRCRGASTAASTTIPAAPGPQVAPAAAPPARNRALAARRAGTNRKARACRAMPSGPSPSRPSSRGPDSTRSTAVAPCSPRSLRESCNALASDRSEEHTSELQSRENLVCRLL